MVWKLNLFQVRALNENDKIWIQKVIEDEWASLKIVTKGKIHYVDRLPGFVALQENEKIGLLTFRIEEDECEIITLNSIIENIGVGKALLNEVEEFSIKNGCKRLWVITTNDNTDALRFYQKKGFKISAIYCNALKESRKLKQEIPQEGLFGIEIRDEIELEKKLK
ncbi:hypothetical protein LCGC14_1689190 [marine sediment metagenome]|uniref:N-acetyltransferase domain-containing protein n=1 Tax=marine sediment metagenome TaxID=412755 RepID=A0A0F9HLT3_9ZZZZ